MLKKIALSLGVVSFMLIASACGRTANIETFSGTIPASLNQQEIISAIEDAGQKRDWIMKKIDSNTIQAVYIARGHSITCNVVFSNTDYSINYVSSKNMDAENGTIHRNYNRWVNNLRHDIDLALMQMDAKK